MGGNIFTYNESEDAYYIQHGADSVPKKLGNERKIFEIDTIIEKQPIDIGFEPLMVYISNNGISGINYSSYAILYRNSTDTPGFTFLNGDASGYNGYSVAGTKITINTPPGGADYRDSFKGKLICT